MFLYIWFGHWRIIDNTWRIFFCVTHRLVKQIKKPLTDLNGCFIEGKFDKSARPDTVLAAALNSFFGDVLKTNHGSIHMSMKWRIHDAIGSGTNSAMLDILPNLQKWMSDDSVAHHNLAPSSNVKGIGSSHRLKFLFCKLIGAIACRAQPLILFLDDLQCKLFLVHCPYLHKEGVQVVSYVANHHIYFSLQGQMKWR